jgi:uncharacterized protein YndB with AHSA1/START domain
VAGHDVEGSGTPHDPWVLKTPPGTSEFEAYRDPDAAPPALVVQVGATELRYHLRCIEDLHAMLAKRGDWMPLGNADEQKPAKPDTVEAWGRSADNPVGGLVRPQEGPTWSVRQLRAAGARSTRDGRGRAQPPQQQDASTVMAKRYHVSRHIDAPVERVWALLTDASTDRAWNRAVVSIEGPITEGATISLVSIVNPKRTFKLKVTEMTPPNRMVWGDSMPTGLFEGERTYRLEEVAGGTEFSMTELLSGPLSGLITRTIPDMTDSFNQFADGLKTAAEAAAPGDPSRPS